LLFKWLDGGLWRRIGASDSEVKVEKVAFVPAQIRAGRALVGCSQEELALEAGIGLTSLRELEGQKRPPDTGAATKIRRALDHRGVAFVPSGRDGEPGVRLIDNRPHIIRRPTQMTFWEGMPFTVEWEGKEVPVFLARTVLDDLGNYTDNPPDESYLQTFEEYRGEILDGVRRAILEGGNINDRGNLYVRNKDIERFNK
jgi:transcriptional regulator with XRE-family HTH domain